jgi:cytochrome P450
MMFALTVANVAYATVLLPLAYWLVWCIYALYFHPLSKYPGPKLAAVSDLWYARTWTGGNWPHVMESLHRRHGPIVRIAPNEISFSTPQSFKDIYGPATKSKKLFRKSELFYDIEIPNIAYERDPEKHVAKHRMFASQFSARALRDQEYLIHQHVDFFIQQIVKWSEKAAAEGKGGINVTETMEWLTFDIMGELTFGESFDAVRNGQTNYWVSILLAAIYGSSVFGLKNRLPILKYILPFLIPKAAVEKYAMHHALTLEKIKRRIEIGDTHGREDFFAGVIRSGKLSDEQMASEANVMLTAGAETSATTLTAVMYFLAMNPACLAKLRGELKEAFGSYAQITGDGTARLAYLNAVVEETMRIFPPSPVGPPRVSPGEVVDGTYVPEGIYVSTDIMSLHRDPENAPAPHTWQPERWLDKKIKPYTVPFSIGPRACIGINLAYLEMRITLAKIVYSLDWQLVDEKTYWPDLCELTQLWKKAPLLVEFKYPNENEAE